MKTLKQWINSLENDGFHVIICKDKQETKAVVHHKDGNIPILFTGLSFPDDNI
jgi:hypothetical protein